MASKTYDRFKTWYGERVDLTSMTAHWFGRQALHSMVKHDLILPWLKCRTDPETLEHASNFIKTRYRDGSFSTDPIVELKDRLEFAEWQKVAEFAEAIEAEREATRTL